MTGLNKTVTFRWDTLQCFPVCPYCLEGYLLADIHPCFNLIYLSTPHWFSENGYRYELDLSTTC